MNTTILLTVAYDGRKFAGYQVQPRQRTVQGELERALSVLHQHHVSTICAGRTDSGVHADGQCVSFVSDHRGIPIERMALAINSRLPADVSVLRARVVPDHFHARYQALSRHYRYQLLSAPTPVPHLRYHAWRVPQPLDLSRLNDEAAVFVGRHDFSTFAARREEHDSMVRCVHYTHFRRTGPLVEFSIGADGFLWHMVRSIVGTLVEREQWRQRGIAVDSSIETLLTRRERKAAGTTAPAWGLFLHRVEYKL